MKQKRNYDKWVVTNVNTVEKTYRSLFTNEKLYGVSFTDRQQAIIDGEYVPDLRKHEVVLVIRKAEQLMQFDIVDSVSQMYEYLFEDGYTPPSEEDVAEAKKILDDLTPDELK